MLLICSIWITINTIDGRIIEKRDIEGKLVKENTANQYLVDFSEGIKRFNASQEYKDYKKMFVDKKECTKE